MILVPLHAHGKPWLESPVPKTAFTTAEGLLMLAGLVLVAIKIAVMTHKGPVFLKASKTRGDTERSDRCESKETIEPCS